MNNNQTERKDQDSKKILTLIVLIAVFMISTTGATYAYFAISASNSVANGTAATVNLTLNVSRVTPTTAKWSSSTQMMVPQLDAALGNAMNSTNSCVDGNGNVVCQVYKIQIENASTSAVRLRGAVYFNITGTFNNLLWREVTNATTMGSNTIYKYSTAEATNATTTTGKPANSTLIGDLLLQKADGTANSGSDYHEYYVVIWISETNADQGTNAATTRKDQGSWTMNVSFKDKANGNGVTSTITS